MALIIRHYETPRHADEAVAALREAGIQDDQIGFLTREGATRHFDLPEDDDPHDMSAAEGATLGGLTGMVVAAVALATPLGPLVAAGPLFGVLAGALAGAATGGVVAALVDEGVDEDVARRLAASLESEAALLLSVHVPAAREAEIRRLLADVEALHPADAAHFQAHHEAHGSGLFDEAAYLRGYEAASLFAPRPFEEVEAELRRGYSGNFDAERSALLAGYRRYLDTIQVVEA